MITRRNTSLTDSKLARKMSIRSPPHARNFKNYADQFESIDDNKRPIQPLYDYNHRCLSPYFLQHLASLDGQAIMYLGLLLRGPDVSTVLGSMFEDSEDIKFIASKLEREGDNNIYYLPDRSYFYCNCHVIVLIYPLTRISSTNNQLLKTFLLFPDLVFIHQGAFESQTFAKALEQTQEAVNVHQVLKSQQKILIYQSPEPINKDANVPVFQTVKELSLKILNNQIWKGLKKNPFRAINQHSKIYIYMLSVIISSCSFPLTFTSQQLADEAIKLYCVSQIEAAYDKFKEKLQKQFPLDQFQLITLLIKKQEEVLSNLRKSLSILNPLLDDQQSIVSSAEDSVNLYNQNILDENRQCAEKFNISLVESLHSGLMEGLSNKKYAKIKDKKQMLTEDVHKMFEEYERKSIDFMSSSKKRENKVAIGGAFSTFNQFMNASKDRFYSSVSHLDDQQSKDNSKDVNEMQVKIEMKKRMLGTLQKQIRALNERKNRIEEQNEILVLKSNQMHDQVKFAFKNSERGSSILDMDQADSMKSLEYRQKMSSSQAEGRGYLQSQEMKMIKSESKGAEKVEGRLKKKMNLIKQERIMEKKKKKFLCCNCCLF